MGIGKPLYKSQVSDYVLSDFSPEEEKFLDRWITHTAEACRLIPRENLEAVKSKQSLKSIESLTL
jgi:peptidyl-tRNA hydrolase